MLSLSELLVETPEDLHDTECGRGDRIGEVTTRGRDGAHDAHGALALGVAKALDTASTLVERGETGAQVRGVTAVSGHLSQTT